MRKSFLLIGGILVSIILRAYFIVNGSEIADIHALHEMGDLIQRGINPYLAINYNIYPPLAIYIEVITIKLSQYLNIPFYILTKVWPNLADIFISLILYRFLIIKSVKPTLAAIWSLIFLLNPISIIISAAHGQIDSIPTLFIVLATYFLTFKSGRLYLFLSALFLGLSITIKPNPLILIPFFLLYKKTNLINTLIFLFLIIAPIAILFMPFLKDDFQVVLDKLLNYSGSKDFGLSAILRGFYYYQTQSYNLNFSDQALSLSKVFFLLGLGILVFIFVKSKKLVKSILAAYLLFLGSYLGISAQYLSWILPFAVLTQDKMLIIFSISGTIALLGFYLFINPTILVAQFSTILPYQDQFMWVYIAGNILLWLTTLIWLSKILLNKPSLL